MPITHSYENNGGVLLVGTGTMTAEDTFKTNRSIYKNPKLTKKIKYQICDYTMVEEWDFSNEEIREIAHQDVSAAKLNPGMLIAVAAKKDLGFGLSRMWEAATYDSGDHFRVFRTVSECRQWVLSQLNDQ